MKLILHEKNNLKSKIKSDLYKYDFKNACQETGACTILCLTLTFLLNKVIK